MGRLRPASSAAIDMVEAAYRLAEDESDWLDHVLQAGFCTMEQAVFATGVTFQGAGDDQIARVQTWRHAGASDEVQKAAVNHAARVPKEVERAWFRQGVVDTASEISDGSRRFFEAIASKTGTIADGLLVNAIDPDGHGAYIAILLPEQTKLHAIEYERWKMLGAHVSAGHRMRAAIGSAKPASTPLPCGAEAMVDPKTFQVIEAAGPAQDRTTAAVLRDSARRVDRARGRLRKTDPDEALQTWWALMHGRWSMVDWFDSDGRRFVLGVPNPPDLGDPRGLTERELQVATYAALGETGKLIGYRLGIAKGAVSRELHTAMHKLGVKTQPQLAKKMGGFARYFGRARKTKSN
ncbi:MAG: helix-turn-helix transcriptional regulator [Myxococcales bacterium]|jgi:DNA-binding CsgD family transcriptional regulator